MSAGLLHNLFSFHLQLFVFIQKHKFPVRFCTLSINIFDYNKRGSTVLLKGIVNYSCIFRFELLVKVLPRNTAILVFAAGECGTNVGFEALY